MSAVRFARDRFPGIAALAANNVAYGPEAVSILDLVDNLEADLSEIDQLHERLTSAANCCARSSFCGDPGYNTDPADYAFGQGRDQCP